MRSVLMLTRSWVALAIVSCGPWAMSPSAVAAEQPVARDDATTMPLGLGGVGGVYLAAEPGELVIEVHPQISPYFNAKAEAMLAEHEIANVTQRMPVTVRYNPKDKDKVSVESW